LNYNIGDIIPLAMPKLQFEDILTLIQNKYPDDLKICERINLGFAIHNYKDRFCNINEYFYAIGDLISEFDKIIKIEAKLKEKGDYLLKRDKLPDQEIVRRSIAKHTENYLFHCSSVVTKKFTHHELTGKCIILYRKFIKLPKVDFIICIYS
jgi:hypothetical protein